MKAKHLLSLFVILAATFCIGSLVLSTSITNQSPASNTRESDGPVDDSDQDKESRSNPPPNSQSETAAAVSASAKDTLTETAEAWEKMLPLFDVDGNVILPTPGTKRGTVSKPDDRPVLPLDWDKAPYPPEHHPEIESFLDDRTAKDRYLGNPPTNVDGDNNVAGQPGLKSYYGHPGVLPRTHRSQHYRLNVGNTDNVPVPFSEDKTEASLEERMARSKILPGTVYPTREKEKKRFATLPEIYARDNIFVTYVKTAPGMYPEVNPFRYPPGTNMLPTVYQNMRDRRNNVMPNTLPSHPNNPYNLHDGEPAVSRLRTLNSPADDLRAILDEMFELVTGVPQRRLWEKLGEQTVEELLEQATDHESQIRRHRDHLLRLSKWGSDLIEGNDGSRSKVPSNRAYRGFGLINHSGHKNRNKRAMPVYGKDGEIVSANIDVHQIWYGGRIQSDTMFYDFGWDDVPLMVKTSTGVKKQWFRDYDDHWDWNLLKAEGDGGLQDENGYVTQDAVALLTRQPEPIPPNVPWTVTYTIDVLHRGEDDFSPTQIYFDDLESIQGGGFKVPAYKVFDESTGKNELTRFGPPHVAMDQTFFPMQEGTRTLLKIKMAPPKYCNVTYTWGWRNHPPRAQAVENSHKRIPPGGPELLYRAPDSENSKLPPTDGVISQHASWPKLPPFARLRIIDHERFVFGGINRSAVPIPGVPTVADEVERYFPERLAGLQRKYPELGDDLTKLKAKLKQDVFDKLANVPFFHPFNVTDPNQDDYLEKGPYSRIGDLSPAKRMWRSFRTMHEFLSDDENDGKKYAECIKQILDAQDAYLDWMDRNHLPSGLRPDPDSDFTMLFVNNTIYGESSHGGLNFDEWVRRSQNPDNEDRQSCDLKLTILNGDYFLHGYINPDFGGNRGWENQFKPTLPLGGSGSFFTFGRFNWRFNSEPGAVGIPPAVRVDSNGDDIVDPNHAGGILSEFEPIYDGSQPAGVRPFAHRVWIRFNYEPSRRLRFYQFDPLHHDAAIFSIH